MSALRHLAATSAALGLAATSLVTGAAAGTAAEARGDVTGALVNVFIERDRSVNMPQTLQPGVHKFVVRSARPSGFQLAMPAEGYTKRELLRDVQRGLEGGNVRAFKRLEANLSFRGGVSSEPEGPGVMWADLDPGTYWALDTQDRTLTVREVRTIRVGGTDLGGDATRGSVIRAVGAVDWAKRPAQIPRRGTVTFRNDSSENHFLGLTKLAPGKTMADFRAWIQAVSQGDESVPPPVDFEVGTETGVVSAGESMSMRYSLPRGNYVMICFWPDADMDLMPHAFMGMYRGIRVG